MPPDDVLVEETALPHPREQVFAWFSAVENLRRITPERFALTVLTPQPIVLRAGVRIAYRMRIFGLPLIWESEITEWDPPRRFADLQVRGPYAHWLHTHEFEELPGGGTLVRDRVVWRLRFGPAGRLAGPLMRRHLTRVFRHRSAALQSAFSPPPGR